MSEYAGALAAACDAARDAGALLREEFHREGGPRGDRDKAPADAEAEALIRERLLAACPDYGFLGEELRDSRRAGTDRDGHCWIVDPNDGTTPFHEGRRGSATSIALLRGHEPVLGVVHAYNWPDDRGRLFAWAEGCGPITLNGEAQPSPRAAAQQALPIVLVSQYGDARPEANASLCAPARYRPLPSIALRLALVAVGEAEMAISVSGPRSWDYAAGDALLRGVGRKVVTAGGDPLPYGGERDGRSPGCFGGDPALIAALLDQEWSASTRGPRIAPGPYPLCMGSRERLVRDVATLSRAQGCWLGLLAGDATGPLAGQPSGDGEMALLLARSLLEVGGFDGTAVTRAYAHGNSAGFSERRDALARIVPLGIYGHALAPQRLEAITRAHCQLSSASAADEEASVVFTAALAHAIAQGPTPRELHDWALAHADARQLSDGALETLQHAVAALPGTPTTDSAASGALLGAAQGRSALPDDLQRAVLTCRPPARPMALWPVDALDLAEALAALSAAAA